MASTLRSGVSGIGDADRSAGCRVRRFEDIGLRDNAARSHAWPQARVRSTRPARRREERQRRSASRCREGTASRSCRRSRPAQPCGRRRSRRSRESAGSRRRVRSSRFRLRRQLARRFREHLGVAVDIVLRRRRATSAPCCGTASAGRRGSARRDGSAGRARGRRRRPPRCRCAAARRGSRYSARQPRRVTCHGSPARRSSSTPARSARASAIIRANASSVSTCVSVARIAASESAFAGERAADTADVRVVRPDRSSRCGRRAPP